MNCLLFQRILAIVGLGVIIGAADSWIRPTRIALNLSAPSAPSDASSSATPAAPPVDPTTPPSITPLPKTDGFRDPLSAAHADIPLGMMIDSVAAKKLFDDGVIFLDARIDEEFKAGHIPQAFHLNSSLFNTPAAANTMKALDQSQPIVIYCGGGDCDASTNLAILLQGAGYTKLHIIQNGFPEWQKLGFPVEKGTK